MPVKQLAIDFESLHTYQDTEHVPHSRETLSQSYTSIDSTKLPSVLQELQSGAEEANYINNRNQS